MQTHVIIPLEEFPETGMHLSGDVDGSIFDIDGADLKSTGPMHYELQAQLYDTELLVQGHVSAPFCLRCDRCLREFDYIATAEEITLSYDTKGKLDVDITDDLREEIVLELPSYPKCELSGQACEINGTFGDFRLDKDPEPGVNSATPSGQSVWDALDQFPTK